jgi:AraC-like DNA-binding protein
MRKTIISRGLDTRKAVIVGANWFQFAPSERIVHPRVLSRMLLWGQEGAGRVRIDGTWHPLETDRFLFLPWGREIVYAAAEVRPFRVGAIHLIPNHPHDRKIEFAVSHRDTDAWARRSWRRDMAWPGLEGVRAGTARPVDPLRLLATYIIERFHGGGLDEAALRSLARLLIEEIARALSLRPASTRGNELVRRAQEFVEAHLDRPVSLPDLARNAGCSASTLRRQFQEALGVPPYEWILQARMARARRLLATTNLRVKEVAEQVGFDDPFQFSRTFRQRAGRSPRVFRDGQAFHPRRL